MICSVEWCIQLWIMSGCLLLSFPRYCIKRIFVWQTYSVILHIWKLGFHYVCDNIPFPIVAAFLLLLHQYWYSLLFLAILTFTTCILSKPMYMRLFWHFPSSWSLNKSLEKIIDKWQITDHGQIQNGDVWQIPVL